MTEAMKRYTGTKTLSARPLTRGDYNVYRGWTPPPDEDQTTGGYLVEYEDGGKANDPRHAGYISWSPADVFERAYHETRSASDQSIETEIQAKGKTAARITPADIEANISGEHYFTAFDGIAGAAYNAANPAGGVEPFTFGPAGAPESLLTFCVLVLRNGFTVTGESACASPENFDAEIGKRIARANAVQKIWPLMGYQLRTALSRTPPPASNAFVAPGCEQFGEPPTS